VGEDRQNHQRLRPYLYKA